MGRGESLGTEVWLVYPAKMKTALKEARRAIGEECCRRGWRLQERHTKASLAPSGRALQLVARRDAIAIYRRMHRARVALLLLGQAMIPLDPSRKPRGARHCVTLEKYARYKAFFVRADPSQPGGTYLCHLQRFAAWCQTVACDGENDPRCLPLYVFDAEWNGKSRLDTLEGRTQFRFSYGRDSRRTDSRGFEWKPHRHGRDSLHVAGLYLSPGFHWDVSDVRGRKGAKRIYTAEGVWAIRPRGHVNIYPDAYVRNGAKSRMIWSG